MADPSLRDANQIKTAGNAFPQEEDQAPKAPWEIQMSQSTNTKTMVYLAADYGTRIGNYHRKGLSNNMDAVYLHKRDLRWLWVGCGWLWWNWGAPEVSAALLLLMACRPHALITGVPTGLTGKSGY